MNVLIVEDDAITALFLEESLTALGHCVLASFDNAESVFNFGQLDNIDLALMDIEINGSVDGIQCAYKLYHTHHISSIFITSYQDSNTIDSAMDVSPLGYLIKPVGQPDIEVALALAKLSQKQKQPKLNFCKTSHSYTYNLEYHTLTYQGDLVKLAKNELKIIELLFKNCNNLVAIQEIKNYVWGDNPHNDESLRQLIYRVRKKLPHLNIISSSKEGYCIKCQE